MAKNKSLPAHLQEKDSSSEHELILYEHHDKPPSGDHGLTFQTHALQMILFGLGIKIASLQQLLVMSLFRAFYCCITLASSG